MKKSILLVSSLLVLVFSGCTHVDRGNLPQMSIGHLGQSYKNDYTVIDTSKEDIRIPKPPAPVVERFEVVGGGCAAEDCDTDRERIELKVSPQNRDTGIGDEQWFTWSIYFPEDYVSVAPTQSCFGQFHNKGHQSPYYMFIENDGYRIKKPSWGGKLSKPLIEDKDLRGKWHTIKIHVKWSSDIKESFFKVWANGELKYEDYDFTYTGQPYFKYGIYRTSVSKYKMPQIEKYLENIEDSDLSFQEEYDKVYEAAQIPTQIVYYSNVRRSRDEAGLNLDWNVP